MIRYSIFLQITPLKFGVYLHLEHISIPAGHIVATCIGQLRAWNDICLENIYRMKGVGRRCLLKASYVPAALLPHNV